MRCPPQERETRCCVYEVAPAFVPPPLPLLVYQATNKPNHRGIKLSNTVCSVPKCLRSRVALVPHNTPRLGQVTGVWGK